MSLVNHLSQSFFLVINILDHPKPAKTYMEIHADLGAFHTEHAFAFHAFPYKHPDKHVCDLMSRLEQRLVHDMEI